jgi:hypothetical protein
MVTDMGTDMVIVTVMGKSVRKRAWGKELRNYSVGRNEFRF